MGKFWPESLTRYSFVIKIGLGDKRFPLLLLLCRGNEGGLNSVWIGCV
jgi:hypothetical protein